MHDILGMQVNQTLQTGLQDLFPPFQRNFVLDKSQKILGEVSIYEYSLTRNAVNRKSQMWAGLDLSSCAGFECREYIFRYVFQNEVLFVGSAEP